MLWEIRADSCVPTPCVTSEGPSVYACEGGIAYKCGITTVAIIWKAEPRVPRPQRSDGVLTPPLVSVPLFPLPASCWGSGESKGEDLSHLQTLEPAGLVTVPQQLQQPLGRQPHLKGLCWPLG